MLARNRSTQSWVGLEDVLWVEGVAGLVYHSAKKLEEIIDEGKSVSLDAAVKIKMSLDILTALHERDALITPSQMPSPMKMDG